MRSEAQKEARRRYEASEKGKAARRRQEENYKLSGGRAATEARRAGKPTSEARKHARKKWAAANQAYFTASRAFRRSLDRAGSVFDKFVLEEAVLLAYLRKKFTNIDWHVDHIVPVSKGGTSVAHNLQVVPASWNRRKSNKHTERFFGNA